MGKDKFFSHIAQTIIIQKRNKQTNNGSTTYVTLPLNSLMRRRYFTSSC